MLLWKHLESTLIRHIIELTDLSISLTTIYDAGFPYHSECTKTETRQIDSYLFPILGLTQRLLMDDLC